MTPLSYQSSNLSLIALETMRLLVLTLASSFSSIVQKLLFKYLLSHNNYSKYELEQKKSKYMKISNPFYSTL